MSRWGNREDSEGVDVIALIKNGVGALEILNVEGYVEEMKRKSAKITER
jgi:hypothetical protein